VTGFDQPCTASANTIGHNAVTNVTVVDPAHPLPPFATTQPAVSGTISQMVNGTLVPVIGAIVQATPPDDDIPLAITHADSAGHYSLCNLPFSERYFGQTIELSASKPVFGAFTLPVLLTGPGTVDIIVP
jgi:hypothetical protein